MISNIYTKITICSIAMFLPLSMLRSMDPIIISQQEDHINRINRGFNDGILEYGLGNKKEAEALLAGAYFYAKQHNLLDYVYPGQLTTVSNLLYDINYKKGYLKTAAECTINNKKKGLIYRHMAQKAHALEQLDLEKKYYAQALNFFEQSYKTDAQARKHYEDALWCGRGYEYNPYAIQNYYLSRLQDASDLRHDYLDPQTYRLSNLIIKQALTKLSKLAHDDASTQCILAKIYVNGEDGIHPNHGKAIEYIRDALCSFAVMPARQYLKEYDDLPIIIKKLYSNANIEISHQALTLEKYWDVLSAIKKEDLIALEKLAHLHEHDTSLASLPLQLLCSCVNPCIAQCLQNITFNDESADAIAFKEFCLSTDGELAAHILEWMSHDISIKSEIKDLFHLMLGGYAYYHHKFDAALAEFKQCSTYKKDLYFLALTAQMDTHEISRKEKIISILPLLYSSLNIPSKNKRCIAAKEIIAEICNYNPSTPIENTLLMCQHWIPQLAVLNSSDYPFEYVQVLMSLNDLRKKTELSIEQQKEIIKLTIYFDFFSLLQAHDQKGLDAFFSKKNEHVKGIRRTILQAIRGNKKNDLQKIVFESSAFKEFCASDLLLLKIIEHIAQYPQEQFKIKPTQCRYLLDGFASLQKENDLTQAFFSHAKILEAIPSQDILTALEPCTSLCNQVKENDKIHIAKTIIANKIIASHKECIGLLLENKEYGQAYKFVHCLTQLDQLIPLQIICNIFAAIETSLIKESPDTYRTLLEISDRISTYNIIKKKADQKNPDCCDCIAFILLEHSKCSHLEELDTTALEKECLNYLSYSLKHDNRTSDEDKRVKRSLYSQLACYFGMLEKSIPLLDEAIKYGNSRALYEKATLLSYKKPINPQDLLITIKLLEQHVISNDNDIRRGKSYKVLGKYYHSIKKLDDQKKAFDYLKAAADLGNYDAGYLLALLYIDGIEGYQIPDIEQALIYLQKTIDLSKKSSYVNARYIRASAYYQEGKYTQAHEDLIHLLDYQGYNDSQKIFAHWLIGLTKLHCNENKDLSEDITSYFRKAYEIALSHQLTNPDSPFIKQFILCNNENTVLTIQKNIDRIIENKKIDAASLDFCTIMGAIILEQCETKLIENPLRQLAVKGLIYAAQNGHEEAPFSLMRTAEEEVDTWDKIYNLVKLLFHKPYLTEIINSLLTEIYPADVISQGILLKRLIEKNDAPILNKYVSQIYEYRKPIATDPISYSLFSYEKTRELIAQCMSITSLMQLADAFMQHPAKSTPEEHFIAMWYGSLLTYSLNPKLLLKGATYLETSRKYFPTTQQKHIEKNLGYIYYKLGWQQRDNNPTLAMGYLKKGVILNSKNCVRLLKELSPVSLQIPSSQQRMDNVQKQLEHFKMLVENQKKHPDYEHLVCPLTDTLTNDRIECTKAIQTITSGQPAVNLVQSDNPKVFLGYAIAVCDDLQNNESVKLSIQNAIKYGTIKNATRSHHVFKDLSILQQVCTLIERIIKKNNHTHMNLLLGTIKREMLKHNIDIKAFERFYKTFYKINLAQNNVWKKVK